MYITVQKKFWAYVTGITIPLSWMIKARTPSVHVESHSSPPHYLCIHLLIGFSKLYMVTILRRRQEERNVTQFKML